MASDPVKKIGKYDVVEVLGQGGMGAVYKAVDPRIGRTVAIKVIKGDFAENPELLKRFYREAQAVGNLQHPNIVIVYDLGEENGNPYLVMEYLDGMPLDKLIAVRQDLAMIQKLEIVIGVLNALHYAHKRNIVHRDVKPANVQLLKDGHVKLLDFGIAREGNLGQTKTGQVMGTMTYMSPEQLNGEVVDGRSDVFSAGIMLFELLTYSLPFEAGDPTSLIVKRLRGDPPPPLSKYFENYPLDLDEIIARSMARDRDERYNTAEDFAFDLARVEERLKRDMVSHFVDQARASIAKSDLAKAKELLSQVLKIDTQHTAAKQLMYEVQATLQREQRGERIQQLRVQAEDAIVGKQFDEATSYVDQAIKLDKTDPDLLNLREQIQQARLRAQQVKKLLNLATVAQQSGQFDMAQKAVEDALALDPDDTDAKVLQASVARSLIEQEKQGQIQQLLQAARREISARQFTAAHDNIRKAESIDPTHPEIPGLKQMVVAGHEQELRRRELAQFCTDIEHLLVDSQSTAARDLAETALRKFPGEPKLVKLKAGAETAIEQEERKAFLEERIANASRLAEAGDAARALALLKEAERQYPTDTRLREFVQVIRQAAAQQAAEKEKQEFLQKARSAMQRKNFVDAIDILEQGVIQYPDDSEIRDLLYAAREDFERLSKKKQVEEVSQQARDLLASHAHTDAIRLLERTSAQVADPDLLRLLEYARQEAAAYRSNLKETQQQATAMLNSGRDTEALKFLEAHVPTFERSAEFQVLLEQTRKHVNEAQQARERLARRIEDSRRLIREGDMFQAEAILRTCQAEAPHEAEVLLLAVELEEAQKGRQLQQQEEARKAREVQEQQETAARAAQAGAGDFRTEIFREAVWGGASSPVTPEEQPAAPMSSTQLFGGTAAHAAPAAPPVEPPAPPTRMGPVGAAPGKAAKTYAPLRRNPRLTAARRS